MPITRSEWEITAAGGLLKATLYAPRGNPDRAPAVLMLMDAPGVRPALCGIAARRAASGYRTLLPNLDWRH